MLKWSRTNSHPSHWHFFQLPMATWDSSPFSDSVSNQLLKDTIAASRPSDLFNPSPKQVLKFSHFNPYLLSQQLPAWVGVCRGFRGTTTTWREEATLLPYCGSHPLHTPSMKSSTCFPLLRSEHRNRQAHCLRISWNSIYASTSHLNNALVLFV